MNSRHNGAEDEEFLFAEEKEKTASAPSGYWKILVVDDEEDIHQITKMALKDFIYDGKKVELLSAYTADEAKKVILDNPDTALVLLDVVMEERDSGLKFVKFLREELGEKMVRIILRTGQPGYAPQARVVMDYDIDDYKEKSELTHDRFFSTVVMALRLFKLMRELDWSRKLIAEQAEAAKRFVPYTFLSILKKSNLTDIQLGDFLEQEISVLFLDIRSFTSMAETLSASETYEFVNELISYLQPCIIAHGGFIDKYIGDAIMALFHADPEKAVLSAISMLDVLKIFNIERQNKGKVPIYAGIGINTGIVALGTVGFHDHMDITVVSDVVNIADRLEHLNKVFETELLISEAVYEKLTDKTAFPHRWIGMMPIRGKKKNISIYEVYAVDPTISQQLKTDSKALFESAMKEYLEGNFESSESKLKEVLAKNSNDTVAKYYLLQCQNKNPVIGEGLT